MTDICINLNDDNQYEPIKDLSTLIQQSAFNLLRQRIQEDLQQSFARTEDGVASTGSGLTYFVDGTRGAGKSTFLHYAYTHLSLKSAFPGKDYRVAQLMFLDPSRIERSELVLLHVLRQLRRLVDGCDHQRRDSEGHTTRFRELFKKMAGGLHLFVSETNSLKDLDAELFLDYGLDRAADSQRLREVLHETIDLVCKMLGAQALLIAVDDADTKATHCQEVLECIRKYLDTPKLIVLVTGDMEMYSLLVQNHFQQDFARDDKGLNADRKKQQNRMVEHLEEQYLLKLFPIQRRVQLNTLHTLLKKEDLQYSISPSQGKATISLANAIDEIATEGLLLRVERDKELFRDHMLKLPVRSVLQVLSTYYKHTSTPKPDTRQAASEALRAMALSSLYRYDIDVESIADGDLQSAVEASFDLGLLDGDPDTAIYLRPQSRELSLRNAYVSLSSDVARICHKSPARSLSYLLTGPGSASIFHLVERNQSTNSARAYRDLDAIELQKRFKQYFSIGRKEDALNWAWHATATLMGATASQSYHLRQGIVGLRSGGKGGATTIDSAIEDALKAASSSNRVYPAIAFSQSSVKQSGGSYRYASIFNTLGLISNLLALPLKDQTILKQEVSRKLQQVLGQLTVSPPSWSGADIFDDSNDENLPDSETLDEHEKIPFKKLVDAIIDWLKLCEKIKENYNPSAVLLGKIWTRIYFSLDNTSAHLRTNNVKSNRCAEAMQLFASSVINACLVEEFDYHAFDPALVKKDKDKNEIQSINRRNPRSSWRDVAMKFDTLGVEPERLPLTFMIASCPLILGLMHDDHSATKLMVAKVKGKLSKFKCGDLSTLTCLNESWNAIGKTTVSTPGAVSTGAKGKNKNETAQDSEIEATPDTAKVK
jgi:hypothetical protein